MEGLLRYRGSVLPGVIAVTVGAFVTLVLTTVGLVIGQGNFYLAEMIVMAGLLLVAWRVRKSRDIALAAIGGGLGIWTLVTLAGWQHDQSIPVPQFVILAADLLVIRFLVHRRGWTLGVRGSTELLVAGIVVFALLVTFVIP